MNSIENNPTDIIGINKMIRDDDVISNADLKDIEDKIINGELFVTNIEPISAQEKYNSICKKIMDDGAATSIGNNDNESILNFGATDEEEMLPIRATTGRGNSDALRQYLYAGEDIKKEPESAPVDDKLLKLEEIENLKSQLNLSREDAAQYEVDKNDDYQTINEVWERLRHKSDLEQYDYLFTQAIEFGAGMVEKIFDGKKEYFGYCPDMTDWSSSVKLKLKRMKPQKTNIVSKMVKKYRLGDLTSISLQLLLSGILYSQTRTRNAEHMQYEQYTTQNEYRDAIYNIDNTN